MRFALFVMLGACIPQQPRLHFTDIEDAALTERSIAFSRSGNFHYELALATGACRWLDDKPAYRRPRVTRPIEGRIEVAGMVYVERGGRRTLVPPDARVEEVIGTDLIVVDGNQLVNVASGRTAPVLTSHLDEPRYVVIGGRVIAWLRSAIVVYDLALDEVARWELAGKHMLPELVTANAHGIVLAEQWKIWHVTLDGVFREYPLDDCRYVPPTR